MSFRVKVLYAALGLIALGLLLRPRWTSTVSVRTLPSHPAHPKALESPIELGRAWVWAPPSEAKVFEWWMKELERWEEDDAMAWLLFDPGDVDWEPDLLRANPNWRPVVGELFILGILGFLVISYTPDKKPSGQE